MEDERFSFDVEWYDAQAELVRHYVLLYFVRESGRNEIEMVDLKTNRKFLKRTPYAELKVSDLYIGSKVVVFSRQLTVAGFADEHTRKHFEGLKGRALLIVKPEAVRHVGKVMGTLFDAKFTIAAMRTVRLSEADAAQLDRAGGRAMARDVCVAMEVVGEDCVPQLLALAGDEDPALARRNNPQSLRATLGTTPEANAVHVSRSREAAEAELALLFGPKRLPSAARSTATFDNCACCVIKPHAVREGSAGAIVDALQQQGFEISAMQLFHLDKAAAEELLEVYRGVMREFTAMVDEFCSGPCIALEVRAESAVSTLREFAGPYDVEVAQHIRPSTLRARFGHDPVRNAVHCTDLPEDGRLECEYFFHILQQHA